MNRFLSSWLAVSTLLAALTIALLCVALPIYVPALQPIAIRAVIFVVVAGAWGVNAWLRSKQESSASSALASSLAGGAAADEEGKLLAARMAAALATLQSTAGGKGGKTYLYSRPWYVIIGPPGAGKTTALVNSGLKFPFSNEEFKGVGGTRNLDFMFSDEAVLVDTAGRYTSQDSDASVDARGWADFLKLLRTHRPKQPINGVIVAIALDELMRGDKAAIDGHAAAVHRRLAEVRQVLEIAVPVYVLVTKADLLAGFVEYHDDLDVNGRRAVLGHTLPFSADRPRGQRLIDAFDEMARNIDARQAGRLFGEKDSQRRALVLGFPAQLSSLRPRLLRFLEGVFVLGDKPVGSLRGFYMTSGMQEGAPLDRLMSGMAQVYDQPRVAVKGSGRAYFLNRLLGEVMFKEAGLVQTDPDTRRRQKLRLGLGIGVIALATVAIAALMVMSFVKGAGTAAAEKPPLVIRQAAAAPADICTAAEGAGCRAG
jgi:type VI secretion system protein ImpL